MYFNYLSNFENIELTLQAQYIITDTAKTVPKYISFELFFLLSVHIIKQSVDSS